ncbi:MAG TPA: hypothetical protein VH143_18230 [Kofleriaceae bacterium]|nr:hypothetical protein [Kofleriaceae bacterium]
MKALALTLVLSACSWTTFGDLSDSTWVHAQETPDSDQSNYAVAIVNSTTDQPGELAVLSGTPANYSTLDFDPTGSTSETLTQPLGQHSISTLSNHPAFVGDGSGDVAIIDKGIDGPLVVIHGTASQLTDSQLSSTDPVDAATFAGADIIAASSGMTPAGGKPNAWLVQATVTNCALVDESGTTPMAASALASDGTNVYAYSRTGEFLVYARTDFETKCESSQTPGPLAPTAHAMTTAPAANGGYIGLVGGSFAILVAYDSPSTMTGAVSVIALGASPSQVGASVATAGVQAAQLATFGEAGPDAPALALGFPSRTVGTTTDVGEVELHMVDATSGAVNGDVWETLSIPQADADLVFGRGLAAMTYNGSTILVVAASNVVYAYYETMVYSDTRQQ